MRLVSKRLWQLQANNKVLRSNIVFHTPLLTTRHFTKSHSIWQKEKSASLTSSTATSNAKPTESPSWNKDTLVSAVVESQQVFGIDPKNLDWSNVKLAVSTLLHLFPRDKYQPFQVCMFIQKENIVITRVSSYKILDHSSHFMIVSKLESKCLKRQ